MDTLQKINCGGFYLGEGLAVEKDENGRNVLSASGGGGVDVTTFYIRANNPTSDHTSLLTEYTFYDSLLPDAEEIPVEDVADIVKEKLELIVTGKTPVFVGVCDYTRVDVSAKTIGRMTVSIQDAKLFLSLPITYYPPGEYARTLDIIIALN